MEFPCANTEYSSFQSSFRYPEFPAVLLNASTGRIESEFHRFVRPTNRPILSDFCRKLTGITQQKIDRADTFPEVFRAFLQWLHAEIIGKDLLFYTKANRDRTIGQNVTFCSWSNNDFKHFFQLEMRRHESERPESMHIWIDFQQEYKVSIDCGNRCSPKPLTHRMCFICHSEKIRLSLFIEACTSLSEYPSWWSCTFRHRRCTESGQSHHASEAEARQCVHLGTILAAADTSDRPD